MKPVAGLTDAPPPRPLSPPLQLFSPSTTSPAPPLPGLTTNLETTSTSLNLGERHVGELDDEEEDKTDDEKEGEEQEEQEGELAVLMDELEQGFEEPTLPRLTEDDVAFDMDEVFHVDVEDNVEESSEEEGDEEGDQSEYDF